MVRQSETVINRYPERITHPCHHNHPLSLLPRNPNGFFSCNACGNHGDGFSYNCNICNVNIHPVCATLPLTLYHSSHYHQLILVFTSPYGSDVFACDMYGGNGGYCWLYTCRACGFDAHLSCAILRPQVINGVIPRSIGPSNTSNQFLPASMCGGGNSSNNATNQILALIGDGGGRGGGGGGLDFSSLLGGGGGGGGGLDFSSLLGGSGGGGVLDFSSLLGNGGDFGGLMGGGCGGFGF